MTLLLTFLMVTLVLFALFWGGTLVAQGYLYQQPVDRLPARAGVAALVVGLFLTVWVWIDQRNPGRYDTFFEFAPYSTTTFDEFEAVRWTAAGGKLVRDPQGNPAETKVKFRKAGGGKAAEFAREGSAPPEPFRLNDSTMMTAALVVNQGGAPVRFDAEFDPKSSKENPTYKSERRFTEAGGSRYITADQLGTVFVPSTGVVAAALFLNFLHFVAWFAAFWLVLRFNWAHALGFAAVFGLTTMLLVMPLLFKPNRAPQRPAPATAEIRSQESVRHLTDEPPLPLSSAV